MIYILTLGEHGPIKIGYVRGNIDRRIAQIQTHCPFKLCLVATLDGDKNREKSLHKTFKHLHMRGEWFTNNGEILRWIRSKITPFSELCSMDERLFNLFHDIVVYAKENPDDNQLLKWYVEFKPRLVKIVGSYRESDPPDYSILHTSEAYDTCYKAMLNQLNY